MAGQSVARAPIDDETPITLAEACELAFRSIVTEASLRAEHSRGMLEIFRIGRQDFTTLRFVREMKERKCRAQSQPHASGSTKSAKRGLTNAGSRPARVRLSPIERGRADRQAG